MGTRPATPKEKGKLSSRRSDGVFAIDLGTTKFCLAVHRGEVGSGVVETISAPANGMRRGMLANLAQAQRALQALLAEGEQALGCDIGRAVVGVAGSHLRSQIIPVSMAVGGEVVTQSDIAKLVSLAEKEAQSPEREVLHVVPAGYRVDAREVVDDPVGFRGRHVAGSFFVVDADRCYAKDIVMLCNEAGVQVTRLCAEPFASASVTVSDTAKGLGVALADIGGGTTDGIVFRAGRPVALFTVNIAGHLMTSDLAIGLNVPPETAEMIKIRFGLKPRPNDSVEVRDIAGRARTITAREVIPILGPRVGELYAHIGRELDLFRLGLGAGFLLTGGGADVLGIAEYFQSKLGIPVARVRPSLGANGVASEGPGERIYHPCRAATAIGLVNLELGRLELKSRHRHGTKGRYLSSFINWIKELS